MQDKDKEDKPVIANLVRDFDKVVVSDKRPDVEIVWSEDETERQVDSQVETPIETVSLSEVKEMYSNRTPVAVVSNRRTRDSRLGAVEKNGRKKTAVEFDLSVVEEALRLFPGVSVTKAMQMLVDSLLATRQGGSNV